MSVNAFNNKILLAFDFKIRNKNSPFLHEFFKKYPSLIDAFDLDENDIINILRVNHRVYSHILNPTLEMKKVVSPYIIEPFFEVYKHLTKETKEAFFTRMFCKRVIDDEFFNLYITPEILEENLYIFEEYIKQGYFWHNITNEKYNNISEKILTLIISDNRFSTLLTNTHNSFFKPNVINKIFQICMDKIKTGEFYRMHFHDFASILDNLCERNIMKRNDIIPLLINFDYKINRNIIGGIDINSLIQHLRNIMRLNYYNSSTNNYCKFIVLQVIKNNDFLTLSKNKIIRNTIENNILYTLDLVLESAKKDDILLMIKQYESNLLTLKSKKLIEYRKKCLDHIIKIYNGK